MKSLTDIEQSRKLAEILPIESADFIRYYNKEDRSYIITDYPDDAMSGEDDIPCWSLAALLEVLPTLDERNPVCCKDIRYNQWHIFYHGTATEELIDTKRHENLIDACHEMVLRLHKQELL